MVERLFFHLRAVLQKSGEVFVGAFREILANDDNGSARRAKVFLSAGENHAELADVDGARGDVRGHVRDQRDSASFGQRMPLRAFDGVVGAEVNVRSVGGNGNFVFAGNADELYWLASAGDAMRNALLQL